MCKKCWDLCMGLSACVFPRNFLKTFETFRSQLSTGRGDLLQSAERWGRVRAWKPEGFLSRAFPCPSPTVKVIFLITPKVVVSVWQMLYNLNGWKWRPHHEKRNTSDPEWQITYVFSNWWKLTYREPKNCVGVKSLEILMLLCWNIPRTWQYTLLSP